MFGKIYVYGGLQDFERDVVKLYNSDLDTWDQIRFAHGQGVARRAT